MSPTLYRPHRSHLWSLVAACHLGMLSLQAEPSPGNRLKWVKDKLSLQVLQGPKELLRYWLEKPEGSASTSPSACYFHPLTTPSGETVTDVAPDDHLHHRGVFLAWLEVRTKSHAGDFWGWGKDAPLENRIIVNTAVEELPATADQAGFRAHNEWRAEGQVLLQEELTSVLRVAPTYHCYDFDYVFRSEEAFQLGQYAFCGFSVRTRKDGALVAHDPAGPVDLPSPSHLKPETDWPDRPWYGFEIRLESGKLLSVALMNHPENPPTLWHNVSKIGLLNPCIVAPSPLRVEAQQPLRLRYRLVCCDGPLPRAKLSELAAEFSGTSSAPLAPN